MMEDSNALRRWLLSCVILIGWLQLSTAPVRGAPPPTREQREIEAPPDQTRAAQPAGGATIAPDPADPNLLLWLDASDRTTVTSEPDQRVSAWSNKAVNVGRKLTSAQEQRPLYVAQALGGRPALRFDGLDDVLRDTGFRQSAQSWTVVLVVTPRSNSGSGQFHALLATNRPEQDDFLTGMNLDLGPSETVQFSAFNLEGIKDASGATNLRTESAPFGEGQIILLSTGSGRSRLWVNGLEEESRAANAAVTAMDELRVGGRFYLRKERGYFHGDVSEVLIYRAELTDAPRAALFAHLLDKYGPDIKRPVASALPDAWAYLPRYDWGSPRRPLALIDEALRTPPVDAQARRALESRLLEALATPSSTCAAKDFVCRRLAIIGSAASVPALAKLLRDPQLAHIACFALARIPDASVDEALRLALRDVPDALRIGVIHALGHRRSVAAVGDLARLLSSENAALGQAAAVALGQIADASAAHALTAALDTAAAPVRKAVVDGCLHCAEQFRAAGQRAEALALYEKLRAADVSTTARSAATRGVIRIGGVAAVPVLIQQLNSGDAKSQALALRLIREMPGTDVTAALASKWNALPPEQRAQMIAALADRGDPAAIPALRAAVESDQTPVRLAAVQALGRLGNAAIVPVLVAIAAGDQADLVAASMHSLATLPGAEVDTAMLELLSRGDAQTRRIVIDLLGRRAYAPATPTLIACARNAEGSIRSAAIRALGTTAAAEDLPTLVDLLAKARDAQEAALAEAAITAVGQASDAKDLCAEKLLGRLGSSPGATKLALLRVLGRLAGPSALQALQTAAGDSDAEVHDTALRALCDWPDAAPAGHLLKVAREGNDEKHRLLALRGYLRMAGQGELPQPQRLSMAQDALRVAQRDDERKVAISVLARVPNAEALVAVLPWLKSETLRDEAGVAAIAISEKLLPNDSATVAEAMEQILRTLKNQDLLRRATEIRTRAR